MKPLYNLYIACCGKDGYVQHAVLCDDGSLQKAERVPLSEPLYLALETGCLHAVLCDPFGTGESGVVTLPLSPSGALSASSAIRPTGGGEGCYVSLFEGALYVANYQTGSVARLDKTGELQVRAHEGHGADAMRQEAPHPHYIAPSPDGKFLLCADLGTDRILTYDGGLHPLYCAHAPEGSGPRHLAYAADGKTVYCVGELGNTVTVFSYENGQLTLRDTVDVLPQPHGESYAAAVRLWGDTLVVSNRGDDSVTLLAADGETVTYRETIPCGGKWPRDCNVFGDFLVCTNEHSDSVTVFRREKGGLSLCSALALSRPLCVVGAPL